MLHSGRLAFAQQGYWVVGNRDNGKCDIVTSNPVIYSYNAYTTGYWFGSGPYQSLDDAKLARSTISACPKVKTPSSRGLTLTSRPSD